MSYVHTYIVHVSSVSVLTRPLLNGAFKTKKSNVSIINGKSEDCDPDDVEEVHSTCDAQSSGFKQQRHCVSRQEGELLTSRGARSTLYTDLVH